MDQRVDQRMDHSPYRKKAKCIEAINGIILLMKKNGIPIPSKYQKSRVHEDLPETPERREAEMERRLKYLEPESRDQIEQKLNDLLVYAEVAKLLRSELIAIIVLSKLRKWEEQLLDPELEMTPLPPPSPKTAEEQLQRELITRERDEAIKEAMKEYDKKGKSRLESIKTMVSPKFGDDARRITLPEQTIVRPPPPTTRAEYLERQQTIKERKERAVGAIKNYEESGRKRAAAARPPQFGDDARRVILPQQTIASPHTQRQGAGAPSVDLEEQRRRDIDQYKRLGAIRKRLNDLPEYERDLAAPKLPPHGLGPSTISDNPTQAADSQRKSKELERKRELDKLRRALQEAMVSNRRNPNNNNNDNDIGQTE